MEEPKNIFERAAEQMKEGRLKAFEGLPTSTKYLSLSDSTDTKEIGNQYPQTDYIDLNLAHSIRYHYLLDQIICFKNIKLYKTSKLTDNISTAAISSNAFLLSKNALDIFERFDLGAYKIHPAKVYHKGTKHEYGILHCVNDLNHLIDFGASSFYISNILGGYEEDIVIQNREDYNIKQRMVEDGEYPNTKKFWSVKLKSAVLNHSQNNDIKIEALPDIFTILSSSEGNYISANLAQAIVDANLTGFEINRVYGIKDGLT